MNYSKIFINHPQPMWLFAKDNDSLLDMNPAARRAYGFTTDAMGLPTLSEIFSEEQLSSFLVQVKGQKLKIARENNSWLQYRSDGSYFQAAILTQDAEHQGLPATLATIMDLASLPQIDRPLHETALKENRQHSSLFNQSNDGVFMSDLEGNHFATNQRASDMLGYTNEALNKLSFREISAEADRSNQLLGQLRDGQDIPVLKRIFRKRTGEDFPVEINVQLVRDDQGQPSYIQSVVRDITRRVRNQRELEAVHQLSTALRAILDRERIMPAILDELMEIMSLAGAGIDLIDLENGGLYIAAANGVWAHHVGGRIPDGTGISHLILDSGESFISNEIDQDARAYNPDAINGCRAAAGIRLESGDAPIGVLWIGSNHQLEQHDLDILKAIGSIAANAIYRSSLHNKTQQQLQRFQMLQQINRSITATFDEKISFRIILQALRSQLNVDAAAALLFDRSSNTLTYAEAIGLGDRVDYTAQYRMSERLAGRAVLERKAVAIPDLAEAGLPIQKLPAEIQETFTSYYAVPLIAKGEVKGVLEVFQRGRLSIDQNWTTFFTVLAEQAAVAIDNAHLFKNIRRSNFELARAYDETIEGWARVLQFRDENTNEDAIRVTDVTVQIAQAAGLEELNFIRWGALLHDIGKVAIPDHILKKPGKLTGEEWRWMRKHPQIAYELLYPIQYLHPALDIPRCHHEKWDGSGYPRGLAGDAIPFAARIFAVVDVWDALMSDRPYRSAWPKERVHDHLRGLSGTHFDPEAVRLFFDVMAGKEESPID
jgi:PAS domain S-box-containing protein